jgi:hypothetical protein
MADGNRKAVRIPPVYNAPIIPDLLLIDFGFVADLERGEPVHAKYFMNQKKGIQQLHFLGIVHLMKLLGFRQAIGDVFPDTNDRSFIDPVDIERNTVGLLNSEGGHNPLFSIHDRSSPYEIRCPR